MAPSPGTCVACKEPFPLNGELASIPDGSTVAFDPADRRVWRICRACGEWNLVGREASNAALPELEARFAAALKTPGDAGFAPAHVGRTLELLRIGGTAVQDQDDVAALRRGKQINRRVATAVPVLALCAIALTTVSTFVYRRHDVGPNLLGLLVCGPMVLLAMGVIRIRHGLPVKRWLMLADAMFLLIGLVFTQLTDPLYGILAWLPVGAVATLLALKLRPFSLLTVPLPRGGSIRFYSTTDLTAATMSWSPDTAAISLHGLPDGRTVHGDDAEVLLRRLVRYGVGMRILTGARSATTQAYDLLRSVGGLRGLLHALDGFRRDSDGRVVIAQLPKVYLLALDLALASPDDSKGPDFRLRRKAAEAALIAGEAEALDRDLSH